MCVCGKKKKKGFPSIWILQGVYRLGAVKVYSACFLLSYAESEVPAFVLQRERRTPAAQPLLFLLLFRPQTFTRMCTEKSKGPPQVDSFSRTGAG